MNLSGRLLKSKQFRMVRFFTPPFSIRRNTFIVIVENGVKLRLNIVDTPGYGDQVNNENWCDLSLTLGH